MKKIHVYTNNPSPSNDQDPLFTVTLTDDNLLLLEESIPNTFSLYFPFNPVLTSASKSKQRFGEIATYPHYGTYQQVQYENTDFDEVSEWAESKPVPVKPADDSRSTIKKFQNGLFSRFFGA